MPIIMLTAKGQESDVVLGLNLGADDYVTKPFSVKELLARANAFLRRRRQPASPVRRFGQLRLDLGSRRLTRRGREVPLTPKEFGLLELFSRRPGRAMTRSEIIKTVWGHDVFVTRRSVDRCVNTLRAKIEDDPARPRFIHTVREIGYRFDV
jgi:DNA-binding response OmpR family regulator